VSFLAGAVFAAWSFAALVSAFSVLDGVVSIFAPRPNPGGVSAVAALELLIGSLGFAFSLERVAALWPW
jgi:hypothetical protein